MRNLADLILRRLAIGAALLIIVSLIVFFAVEALPGVVSDKSAQASEALGACIL